MDLGEVLGRTWQITWKNKGLWLLGVLAGCSGAGGRAGSRIEIKTEGGEFPQVERFFEPFVRNMERFFGDIPEDRMPF